MSTTKYIRYYPEYDAIDNCGFPQDINDFRDEDLVKASAHLPNSPDGHESEAGSISLPVKCVGVGFTYTELRTAADRYIEEHAGIPVQANPESQRDWIA